jgi:hypothetical protein
MESVRSNAPPEPTRCNGEIGERGSAGVLAPLVLREDRAVPRAVRRIDVLLPERLDLKVDGGDTGLGLSWDREC